MENILIFFAGIIIGIESKKIICFVSKELFNNENEKMFSEKFYKKEDSDFIKQWENLMNYNGENQMEDEYEKE